MSHTNPGEEVILEADSNMHYYEVSGFVRIVGLLLRLIIGINRIMSVENIKTALRSKDIYYPPTQTVMGTTVLLTF